MNQRCFSFRHSSLFSLIILGLIVMCVVSPVGAVSYSATELSGIIGTPVGINDAGQVISTQTYYSNSEFGPSLIAESYLWTNGTSQYLGSYANGINDSGHTAGYDYNDWENVRFPWIDGGSISGMVDEGEAWGINNLGQVVGVMVFDGGAWHAFEYDSGTVVDLTPTWTGASVGTAINLSGQIVINQDNEYGSSYLWDDGVLTSTGLWNSRAINDSGQILGESAIGPAIWQDGVTTLLEACPSRGVRWLSGINNSGQVVGCYADGGGFIWEEGVMSDIDSLIVGSPGLGIPSVGSINNSGEIIAVDGLSRVVLLTPVPEPSCLAALFVGAVGFLTLRRRSA